MAQPSPENSEWLTRNQHIDKELRAAGWKVTPHAKGRMVVDADHQEKCRGGAAC